MRQRRPLTPREIARKRRGGRASAEKARQNPKPGGSFQTDRVYRPYVDWSRRER